MTSPAINAKKSLANMVRGARRWVILAMLLSLHAALVSPVGSEFERACLLVHFGLFLLWQPFISTDRELNLLAVLLLLGITGVVLYVLAPWMMVAWLAILIGIMGGKVFTQQADRFGRFYVAAVFYLFAILLVWAVPLFLLGISVFPVGLQSVVTFFLPLVLIAMVFLPYEAEHEGHAQVFDFFYSLLIFQLVVVLVLGSISAMRVTENQYFQAVVLTVLALAIGLFILGVLWGPRTGFGKLRTYFSRYLMSVGMPFELWMRRIAELSETDISSAKFLQHAMNEVATMPWLTGADWHSPDGAGTFGEKTIHTASYQYHQLAVTFHSESSLSPAMLLHLRLLAQVVGEFYEGKRREQTLKQNTYIQAVHETGARLTHDIKNLLQSLYALASAGTTEAQKPKPDIDRRPPSPYEALLGRQLPQLTKRLQTTLDKLQNPAANTHGVTMRASEWWAEALARHADTGVNFLAAGEMNELIPAALFDTVLENCLENARQKRQREPDIEISVEYSDNPSPSLSITDTGSAISNAAMEKLFHAPIVGTPTSGLGIGLFQAAKQAEQEGFGLGVEGNEIGCVRFALAAKLNGKD
jgi:signal transduction histidine kinase